MKPATSLCCLRVAIGTDRCTRIEPPTASATDRQIRNTPKGMLMEGRLSGNRIPQGRSRYYLSGHGANYSRRHQATGIRFQDDCSTDPRRSVGTLGMVVGE